MLTSELLGCFNEGLCDFGHLGLKDSALFLVFLQVNLDRLLVDFVRDLEHANKEDRYDPHLRLSGEFGQLCLHCVPLLDVASSDGGAAPTLVLFQSFLGRRNHVTMRHHAAGLEVLPFHGAITLVLDLTERLGFFLHRVQNFVGGLAAHHCCLLHLLDLCQLVMLAFVGVLLEPMAIRIDGVMFEDLHHVGHCGAEFKLHRAVKFLSFVHIDLLEVRVRHTLLTKYLNRVLMVNL